MSTYLHGHGTRETPQSEPIPGSAQVPNSAGGYSFPVDKWTRLERFLILGSEGGTYYIGEADLTKGNIDALRECVADDGLRVVRTIREVSVAGRNVKQEPVMFALAYCAGAPDEKTRQTALSVLADVCRTGSHLLLFASYVQNFRGWGRSLRAALGAWYSRDVSEVAFQTLKYRQRYGFTHADLLRKAHPGKKVSSGNPETDVTGAHEALFDFLVDDTPPEAGVVEAIDVFLLCQGAHDPGATAALIRSARKAIPREFLQTEHLADPDVNRALVERGMPMTALIRNLANLTRYGVLEQTGEYTKLVADAITNTEALRKARVHPYAVLLALKTYELGVSPRKNPHAVLYSTGGFGGRYEKDWQPIPKIIDALDDAFYASFGNVEPTGKRTLIGLDVSGSMNHPVMGGTENPSAISCRAASAAMSMVTARAEQDYAVMGFTDEFVPLSISPRQRLDDVVKSIDGLRFGRTDCSLPMRWAEQHNVAIDTFIVYTDNETWAGPVHPTQALERYRQQSGIAAKLIVVGMYANEFSIADPNDGGMLDVVGFDASAPNVIADFSRD